MLSFFRRGGAGQAIVGAIVFAIILVFVLEFRAGRGAQGVSLSSDCAIEVSERCISVKEFRAAQGLLSPPYVEPKQLRELNLLQRAADGLVERELLLEEAERLGLSVSEEATDRELSQGRARASLPTGMSEQLALNLGLCQPESSGWSCMPGTVGIRLLPVKNSKTGKFDYNVYSRVVRNRTNRSPREFKAMQQRELTAERVRNLVKSRAQISEPEAFEQYLRARSTVRANTVELNKDWFERFVVRADPAAVSDWVQEHEAEVSEAWKEAKASFTPGCALVVQIQSTFGAEADDDDKALLRERLETAKALLAAGVPFEDVARQLADPSDTSGGGVACLPKDAPAELAEVVRTLPVGSVSPIVETSNGFSVVKHLGSLAEDEVEATGRAAVARRLVLSHLAEAAVAAAQQRIVERLESGQTLEAAVDALVEELVPTGTRGVSAVPGGVAKAEPLALASPKRPTVRDLGEFTASARPLPNAVPTEAYAAKAFELEPGAHLAIDLTDGKAVLVVKGKEMATKDAFEKDKRELLDRALAAKQEEALVRYVAALRKAAEGKIRIAPELVAPPKSPQGEG